MLVKDSMKLSGVGFIDHRTASPLLHHPSARGIVMKVAIIVYVAAAITMSCTSAVTSRCHYPPYAHILVGAFWPTVGALVAFTLISDIDVLSAGKSCQ